MSKEQKKMESWSWRTKPRSIIKTIQWFPYFAALNGKNWEEKSDYYSRYNDKQVHPVRRSYIYNAHREEDTFLSAMSFREYLSGEKDVKETESNGRNDKTTFEFYGFGYVNKEGNIVVTEAGRKITEETFDNEDYLKQLLKMRFPNYTYQKNCINGSEGVFPFKLLLRAISEYEYLNRSEIALLFGCTKDENLPQMLLAIKTFREKYLALSNKLDLLKVKEVFAETFTECYGSMPNKPDSYYDYAEAMSRSLVYTGLFSLSGRSIASKIRVSEHSKTKVRMLVEKYIFQFPDEIKDLDSYMSWYGSCENVKLPWEDPDDRKRIIEDKAEILLKKLSSDQSSESAEKELLNVRKLLKKAEQTKSSNDLRIVEKQISDAITNWNEKYFIEVLSKTDKERRSIIEKFKDILDNDDMSALWLEVNTWKSLIAMDGHKTLKRNFNIEDDLTPRSFAPGIGNTPDMELYGENYILIPEVSLMTGVRQWEHEGSSVIDHVIHFIESYKEVQVIGLFISSRINIRTLWQFFILNRESWLGKSVPVIPFTITQYVAIIETIYSTKGTIDDFKNLLCVIIDCARVIENYGQWEKQIEDEIVQWKKERNKAR